MKKEKLFKIGVINESTIDVVKDMTTFYTSDTELWLGFELSEENVEFDSAEILLFNIDDKSFVVRSVVKIDNKYWYELDMDMLGHHGQWKAQLQFTKNSEVYTSKHFNFRIENDLSNERPPKLIDITNWSNIKQTADSLIVEMKVALKEAIAAEQNRAEAFTQAEQERQSSFETAESERNQTFESNETTRQTQELEREKAEVKRQSNFDDNEASRVETFNTNEATRQANENTRQQAESGRQSAELIRVESETLRIERDISREVEITNLKNANFINVKNLADNGDFSNGTANWYANYATLEDLGSAVRISGDGTVPTMRLYKNLSVKSNDVYYFYFQYSDASQNYTIGIRYMPNSRKESGTNGIYSALSYFVSDNTNFQFEFIGVSSVGNILVSNIIALNLTNIFGAGNEPTKEVMDWIINSNGYFDELTLRRHDIQQYEINQLRKAVLALGGTI